MYDTKVRIPSLHRSVLYHVTYDAVGPPPSPPGFGHVTGPRDDVTGVLSLLRVPLLRRGVCDWGGESAR